MSVKTYTDSTTRIITKTIEEHVWEIHCDAIGCNNSLEFRENRDTGDITADGDYTGPDMDTEWLNIHDTNTAIKTALQHGWQEGNKGIQRGHLYCPTHTTKTNKTPTTKKETTPALAGIGKGEPMTALLASPSAASKPEDSQSCTDAIPAWCTTNPYGNPYWTFWADGPCISCATRRKHEPTM